jgi:1,4-dihydroxy-2-naphthoate octaprenyltransferase
MASVCPVAIGTALALRDGTWHARAAVAALVGAIAIQIGTNFCNDYFDFVQGADTSARLGPTRAVQAGLISPRAMLLATAATFSAAAIVCGYLIVRGGWPLAVIGAMSILSGILYTAGRHSLAYLGLGDLFVLVFFGPVAVCGTYYVQALRLTTPVLVSGIAPGCIAVGILVVNNLRDMDQDARAQKKTLAVRFGAEFARLEYLLSMILAALVPVALWLLWEWPTAILLASLTLLPGFLVARSLWQSSGVALNPRLGQTAGVLGLYTLAFCFVCLVI